MTRGLPAAVTFSIAWRMSAGARNCPFLMLTTRPVRAAATSRSVCRERNAGNLQHVGDLGDRRRVRGSWMSVRIGTPARLAHAREDAQPLVEARAAERSPRRAVGLVVRGLEDERDAGAARDVADRERQVDRVRLALDDAGPGDEQQRSAAAHREPGKLESAARRLTLPRRPPPAVPRRASLCRWLASTNPANSGCGLSGFDLNSGWNCTATYHGCDGSSTISTNLPSSDRPTISQPVLGQRLLVEAVELVAMAVPLVDDVLAIELARPRARLQLARVGAEPHRAAEVVDAEQVAQLVDDACAACPGVHSVESASARPHTCRAYSTAAHWKP